MKLSARLTALKKQKQSKPRQAGSGQRPGGRFSRWGLAWLALGLMAAGAGTLAALELFVWNNVPPALVGTWEVEEGPQYGGTFAFSRTGNLVVHLKSQKGDFTLKSQAVVDGKTLQTTSYNPETRQEETHTSTIRELTADSLILELENGDLLRLVRKK